jgi:hypothetical protein
MKWSPTGWGAEITGETGDYTVPVEKWRAKNEALVADPDKAKLLPAAVGFASVLVGPACVYLTVASYIALIRADDGPAWWAMVLATIPYGFLIAFSGFVPHGIWIVCAACDPYDRLDLYDSLPPHENHTAGPGSRRTSTPREPGQDDFAATG